MLNTITSPTICFYVHHHGSGHLMRALSIAGTLTNFSVIFMGSNLKPYADLINHTIECIHLPTDLPLADDQFESGEHLPFVHYAPLGVAGIRNRTAMMTAVFQRSFPMILIVDVSVEVTLLARLCGIPTIVVLQHGNRSDTAHLNAYSSAELLIAPYSAELVSPQSRLIHPEKTMYSGGFSRYTGVYINPEQMEHKNHVAILLGKGGTSIDDQFIRFLAVQCENYRFHVIGCVQPDEINNIVWHGQMDDPLKILRSCAVVIGNGGHNTVMEMADLRKRFICIPEDRPFDEQWHKAALLEKGGHATVIDSAAIYTHNWKELIEVTSKSEPNWAGVIDPHALKYISSAINAVTFRFFNYPAA